MEYRDVHGIFPKNTAWRFPSPGSEKFTKESEGFKYKCDYKTPYRESPYFVRNQPPVIEPEYTLYSTIKITQQDIDEYTKDFPAVRGKHLVLMMFRNC